jgi:hypothetical protein
MTSALVGRVRSASSPGRFTLGERAPGNHCKGGWVGHRAGLDAVGKRKILSIPGLELRPLGCPDDGEYENQCLVECDAVYCGDGFG